MGGGAARAGEDEEVRRGGEADQAILVGVRHRLRLATMVGYGHAESAEPSGDGFADAAETENAGGFTAESGGQGELAREPLALVQKAIGLDKATAGHEDKRRGKVGDIVGEHVWSVGEANTALPAGGKVHAIVTDPAESDDFEIGQAGKEMGGDL